MTTLHAGLAPVREVLANGVVVIAKHSPATPAVTIHACVGAGSIFDPPGAPGTAHFVSRTIDRGTSRRSGDSIAEALEDRGISLAISLNRHVMQFVITCLVEDCALALATLADVLINPTFPDEEVETRRGEVTTLIRQDEDSPAAVSGERMMALLYGPDHPYGWRPRGSVDAIDRLAPADLRHFHGAYFSPSALSLVLVGDIPPERAIAAARSTLEFWQSGPARRISLRSPERRSTRSVAVVPMMNKAQTDISYGLLSVRRSDPDYYAMWLLNNVLGQYSLGGRLGESIRERQGMAYYIFSAADPDIIEGPLVVRAGVAADNVERCVESIDRELASLAREGPTAREIDDSRQYLIGSMPRKLETNAGIASFLQTSEFFQLGLEYDVRMPGLLQAVTPDEVHAAARRLLDPARAVVVVAGPYDGAVQ